MPRNDDDPCNRADNGSGTIDELLEQGKANADLRADQYIFIDMFAVAILVGEGAGIDNAVDVKLVGKEQ